MATYRERELARDKARAKAQEAASRKRAEILDGGTFERFFVVHVSSNVTEVWTIYYNWPTDIGIFSPDWVTSNFTKIGGVEFGDSLPPMEPAEALAALWAKANDSKFIVRGEA